MMFKTTDADIQRGKVGLGTQNLKHVWFSSVAVEPKTKVSVSMMRS